jgi:WXG100 family type VII secretion target
VDIAVGNITNIHNRLQEIPATLGAAWQSSSATIYKQVLTEWNDEFRKVLAALDDIGRKLKESDIQYTDATTTSRDLAENLRAQLSAGTYKV